MAVVPLVPGSINIQIQRGAYQQFKSTAVLDFAGAAVDLSGWFSYTAKLVPTSPNPNTADVTFGTVTGAASGIATLTVASTDLASNPTGTAKLLITGVKVSGDNPQLLASGTAQLSDG